MKIWNCVYESRFELCETEGNFKKKILGGCHKEDSPPKYTNIGVAGEGNCVKSKREAWARKTEIRNLN